MKKRLIAEEDVMQTNIIQAKVGFYGGRQAEYCKWIDILLSSNNW